MIVIEPPLPIPPGLLIEFTGEIARRWLVEACILTPEEASIATVRYDRERRAIEVPGKATYSLSYVDELRERNLARRVP